MKKLYLSTDYADAYNNLGVALQDYGKLDEAIEAYKKAISIKPRYAANNNMANTLKDKGILKEAIEAYEKAISIKSDYADAYNNLGVALQDYGKLDEAIEAYKKAISIKPDYVEAHRNLSRITKYNKNNPQIGQLEKLLKNKQLSSDANVM